MKYTCKYCNRTFSKKNIKFNATVCHSCDTSKRRWKSRVKLLEMLGGECEKCGFKGNPAALQFHHIDPSNKKYSLHSKNLLRSDRVEEAKKCIVLCANCHLAEHTNKEFLKKIGVFPLTEKKK
jgi:hypothetical protein